MKKLVLLQVLFFFIISITAIGQTKVVYSTTFDTNDGKWSDIPRDDEKYYRVIKDGKLQIEHRDGEESYITYLTPYIDKNKPFIIEYDLVVHQGDDASVLIQLESRNGNFYYFQLMPALQAFSVITYSTEKDEWKTIAKKKTKNDLTQSTFINGLGENNHIQIRVSESDITYTINDQVIFNEKTSSLIPYEYFRSIGINTTQKSKLSIDNFTFKQDSEAINLAVDGVFTDPEILPKSINLKNTERKPVITHDGKTLYFIRVMNKDNGDDDIWLSNLEADSTWGNSKSIGAPLNTFDHNGVVSASSDNNSLVVMSNYDKSKSSPIYISRRTPAGWSKPVNIEIDGFYNNGESIEASLSNDNAVLILAIENKDSYGRNDFYVSFRKQDGSYTKPQNMGTQLNTWGWEVSPFIAGDNKTLYFSTDGLPGYGRQDIFVSKRLDNSWTNWSKPINLGPQVNSSSWDTYFTTPVSGEIAYMSSDRSGSPKIYQLNISLANKPEAVNTFSGKVINAKTGEPISTDIEIRTLLTDSLITTITSLPSDGSYFAVLNKGYEYSFSAVKEGYYPESKNVDLTNLNTYTNTIEDLILHPFEKGQIIRLNNIFFDRGTATILPTSIPELDKLVNLLEDKC